MPLSNTAWIGIPASKLCRAGKSRFSGVRTASSDEARNFWTHDKLLLGERACHVVARALQCVGKTGSRRNVLRARRRLLRQPPRPDVAVGLQARSVSQLERSDVAGEMRAAQG